uniref:Uncharacterized protein n=1 Tax=Lactuca sativa TaxID=4236 RepID=A0A9R1UT12_LACSA|nr:hypothetical protein LSAT_V11C800392070 [Lactuca sativa]
MDTCLPWGGGFTGLKQHIGHVPRNVSRCPNSTKDDQLRMRNFINDGKIKKKAKHEHDKALRSEAIQVLNDSVEMDEIEDSLGLKTPSYIGPMDGYANKINPEIMKGKGKKADLNDVVRNERILAFHKFISKWAYKTKFLFMHWKI